MAEPLPMSHYKAQYQDVSRNDLLRIIAHLHADLENANAGVAAMDRHLVRFNLHMAEAESILKDLQDDSKVAAKHKRRIRRAFEMAQITEPDGAPPEKCPECGSTEIRNAGHGYHVCEQCGRRSMHEQPVEDG